MKNTIFGLLGSLLLGAPAVAQDQFDYTTNADNSLTITRYSGTNAAVTIPSTIDGLSVTAIGDFAFYGMWKDRADIGDSVEYVNRLRQDLRS